MSTISSFAPPLLLDAAMAPPAPSPVSRSKPFAVEATMYGRVVTLKDLRAKLESKGMEPAHVQAIISKVQGLAEKTSQLAAAKFKDLNNDHLIVVAGVVAAVKDDRITSMGDVDAEMAKNTKSIISIFKESFVDEFVDETVDKKPAVPPVYQRNISEIISKNHMTEKFEENFKELYAKFNAKTKELEALSAPSTEEFLKKLTKFKDNFVDFSNTLKTIHYQYTQKHKPKEDDKALQGIKALMQLCDMQLERIDENIKPESALEPAISDPLPVTPPMPALLKQAVQNAESDSPILH